MSLHSAKAKADYFSSFSKKTTISVFPFYLLSLPSLLDNPYHFFRLNNKRLDWKILYVASHKKSFVRLARIHCNFVKNNIVWISGLFFGCNAGKFFAVFYNVLNDRINYCIGKFKLLSMKNFFVFSYNFFAVNRFYDSSQCVLNNFSRIRFFFYQRRNKNICVYNCKNIHSLFSFSNGKGS